MSPLDDELHDALHGRAAVIAPPADPMAGIERRARGIRRRRLTASVAGAALVISGLAVIVPSLLPATTSAPPASPPTASPTPTTVTADALDPADPWALRGELAPSALAALQSAWTTAHPGSTLSVLFGQVYEPSGLPEAVFVASGGGGPRYGFARIRGTAAELVVDQPLATGTMALALALGGDELPRLLVVASETATDVSYSRDGASFASIARAKGVGIVGLEGDTARDRIRVTDSAGQVAYDEPAPDFAGDETGTDNVLDWPTRGAMESDVLPAAKAAWAQSLGTTVDKLGVKILFAGDTDSGVTYVMGQAWAPDKKARQVSYSEGGTNGPQPFIGPITGKEPVLLAFLVGSLPGTSTDELVVIPQPRTGQVSYDDDASGAFRPVEGQDFREGVVIIDRSKRATNDRLEVLDGNGDLDKPTYRGPVAPLLCGSKECG